MGVNQSGIPKCWLVELSLKPWLKPWFLCIYLEIKPFQDSVHQQVRDSTNTRHRESTWKTYFLKACHGNGGRLAGDSVPGMRPQGFKSAVWSRGMGVSTSLGDPPKNEVSFYLPMLGSVS